MKTWFIRCHLWNACRLYIHLAFTYSSGPSSIVWSELGPALPFPESAWSVMVTGSESHVWSGPNLHKSLSLSLSWMIWNFHQILFKLFCVQGLRKIILEENKLTLYTITSKSIFTLYHIQSIVCVWGPKSGSKSILGLKDPRCTFTTYVTFSMNPYTKKCIKKYIRIMFHLTYIIEFIFHTTR